MLRSVRPPPPELLRRADRQDSVLTAAQCRAAGVSDDWLAWRARSGSWQRVFRGVYVAHSGPLPWRTQATAALLFAGAPDAPAALSHDAAAHLHGFLARPPARFDVWVPHERWIRAPEPLRLRRGRREVERAAGLPVVSAGDTVLDLVGTARDDDRAIGLIADAVRAGTAPGAIRTALERRPTTPRRALLLELLALSEAGVESPLELRYHRDVECAHGLPTAELQVREVVDGSWIRSDRRYTGYRVRCELDGRVGHPGGRTDADTWRDNAVLVASDDMTLRYRWSHVRVTPCRTTVQVVAALRAGGWRGVPHPCGAGCPVR